MQQISFMKRVSVDVRVSIFGNVMFWAWVSLSASTQPHTLSFKKNLYSQWKKTYRTQPQPHSEIDDVSFPWLLEKPGFETVHRQFSRSAIFSLNVIAQNCVFVIWYSNLERETQHFNGRKKIQNFEDCLKEWDRMKLPLLLPLVTYASATVCDIASDANTPCQAAFSLTRAL